MPVPACAAHHDGNGPLNNQTHPLDDLLGIRYEERSAHQAITALTVSPHLYQSTGVLHGGVTSALVESAVGAGAAFNVGDGHGVSGAESQVHFLRPVVSGVLRACATPVHCGRTQQLWRAGVFDPKDQLVAWATVRLLNTEQPGALSVECEGIR